MKISPSRYKFKYLHSSPNTFTTDSSSCKIQTMIEIIDDQERWLEEFEVIAKQLRDGLGGLAFRVDHIGSTSVLGLAAKDIIDIQVTVEKLEPFCVSRVSAF
jgi:GrpB-like predicted nucleotidyltransferase (UPF0157 family)